MNAVAVCFALVMLVTYAIGIGLRTYHVVIWGTVLVAGALPVWDGPDPSNIGLLLAGAGVVLTGVFDHRLFVQTFGPRRAIDYEIARQIEAIEALGQLELAIGHSL